MAEKEKKKSVKKAAEEGGEEKEHKVPWQEQYATAKEIKAFLDNHIYLRWNSVKHRVEARLPTEDAFCQNSELALFVSDDYQPMSDRLSNTLLTALQDVKPTRKRDLEDVINSGYVKPFHPFLYYLNRLPPWDGQDHILGLSVGPYPRTVGVSDGQGRHGEADALLRVPEEMARGDGGELDRRR